MRIAPIRLAVPIVTVALLSATALRAEEPPPPTDAELTKFIAIENDLFSDPGRAEEVCGEIDSAKQGDEKSDPDMAVVGRRLEASGVFGPVLRAHGMSGKRYFEVSVHVAGALIGLGIADELDTTARSQGKSATNRSAAIAKSPAVAVVAARQAELTEALKKYDKLCGDAEEDEGGDDSGSSDPDDGGAG
jgi:hypothetical protein